MEEKVKQQIIVRQSQLKNSLDYWRMLGVKPTLIEVIRVARLLSVFCIDGYNEKTLELVEQGDKYLEEKFKED